MQKDLIEVTTD